MAIACHGHVYTSSASGQERKMAQRSVLNDKLQEQVGNLLRPGSVCLTATAYRTVSGCHFGCYRSGSSR